MSRNIPTIDLLFLLAESRDVPQHVGGVMVFQNPSANAGWTIGDLVSKYREAKPIKPFNVIPKFSIAGLPRWQEVEKFDMNYHVQHLALPAPGTEAQLNELVQRWHSELLDRSHPLFQVRVVEGLSDGRFVIFVKLHHSIVDGASAIARILAGVDSDPQGPIGLPMFAVGVPASEPSARPSAQNMMKFLPPQYGKLLQNASTALSLTTEAWKKTAYRLAGGKATGSTPFETPRTVLNDRIRQGRLYSRVSLPAAPLRAAGKAVGATLNDVMLALVDSAVHRFLKECDAPVDAKLVALVPISLREAGDTEATTKISVAVVPMGDPSAEMPERLEQIVKRMQGAKEEAKARSKAAASGYSVALYAAAQGLERLGVQRTLANVLVSNVPGTNEQMYLGGARLLGIYPVNVITVGMGLSVTLVSYAGRLDVGIVSQNRPFIKLQRLADLVEEGMHALLAAHVPVAIASASAATKPARKSRAAAPVELIEVAKAKKTPTQAKRKRVASTVAASA